MLLSELYLQRNRAEKKIKVSIISNLALMCNICGGPLNAWMPGVTASSRAILCSAGGHKSQSHHLLMLLSGDPTSCFTVNSSTQRHRDLMKMKDLSTKNETWGKTHEPQPPVLLSETSKWCWCHVCFLKTYSPLYLCMITAAWLRSGKIVVMVMKKQTLIVVWDVMWTLVSCYTPIHHSILHTLTFSHAA